MVKPEKKAVDERQDKEIKDLQTWRDGIDRVVHGDDQFKWRGIMEEHRDLSAHTANIENNVQTITNEILGFKKAVQGFFKYLGVFVGFVATIAGLLKAFGVI